LGCKSQPFGGDNETIILSQQKSVINQNKQGCTNPSKKKKKNCEGDLSFLAAIIVDNPAVVS